MDLCIKLFKTMEILHFYSQNIFSLLLYVVNNKRLFIKNLEVHNHDAISANNSHLPITKRTIYQKGAHFVGFKIFNHLPSHIKSLENEMKVFKLTLKKFHHCTSF